MTDNAILMSIGGTGLMEAARPLAVGINKLSLQPGDVLVVTLPAGRPREDALEIREILSRVLPDHALAVVLPGDYALTVLRNGQPVEPETDEPAMVG